MRIWEIFEYDYADDKTANILRKQAAGNTINFIMYMHPGTFLKLTTPEDELSKKDIKSRSLNRNYEDPEKQKKHNHPYLEINIKTGKVEGHEGRARAQYALDKGSTRFPVGIKLSPSHTQDGTPLDEEYIPSIWTGQYNDDIKFNFLNAFEHNRENSEDTGRELSPNEIEITKIAKNRFGYGEKEPYDDFEFDPAMKPGNKVQQKDHSMDDSIENISTKNIDKILHELSEDPDAINDKQKTKLIKFLEDYITDADTLAEVLNKVSSTEIKPEIYHQYFNNINENLKQNFENGQFKNFIDNVKKYMKSLEEIQSYISDYEHDKIEELLEPVIKKVSNKLRNTIKNYDGNNIEPIVHVSQIIKTFSDIFNEEYSSKLSDYFIFREYFSSKHSKNEFIDFDEDENQAIISTSSGDEKTINFD